MMCCSAHDGEREPRRRGAVIARSVSDEAIHVWLAALWIASRSLSLGTPFARTRWLAMTKLDRRRDKTTRQANHFPDFQSPLSIPSRKTIFRLTVGQITA